MIYNLGRWQYHPSGYIKHRIFGFYFKTNIRASNYRHGVKLVNKLAEGLNETN